MEGVFSGEEIEGEFVGFSSGNAEMQGGADIARLEMLPVMKGVEFGHDLPPAFGVSQMADEKQVALEPFGIEPAEQGHGQSGGKVEAFPKRPLFELGRRTFEAFAEEQF